MNAHALRACVIARLPEVRILSSPHMLEIHPFGSFVPHTSKHLILGSFPGRLSKENNWFYCTKRNQFWTILESVYKTKLDTKAKKQKLFKKLGIAVTDIVLSCDRKSGTNSDTNLTNIIYNTKTISKILKENNIKQIFFTSRFVEKKFLRLFPDIPYTITLPSPSPRFAKISLSDKITKYKKLLPKL